ncbi:MAG: hypothetical protein ABJQ29_10625 [Luteolibacter sp.]
MPQSDKATDTPPPVCDNCGRESAIVIEGKGWCVDCFQARGSCCSGEFDRTDEPD